MTQIESKRRFEEKESFTHKLSKELLREWIVGNHQFYDTYLNCDIDFIDQKTGKYESVNWRAQYVSLEYPITLNFPDNIDETSACKKTDEKNCSYRWSKEKYCPCLKCKYFDKSQLLYVADLAIGHKGLTACVIEVCHKNPLDQIKKWQIRDMLNTNCIGLSAFEIDAQHILGQIGKPKQLFVRSF